MSSETHRRIARPFRTSRRPALRTTPRDHRLEGLDALESRTLLDATLFLNGLGVLSRSDGSPLPVGSTVVLLVDADSDGFGDLTQATTSFKADSGDVVLDRFAFNHQGGEGVFSGSSVFNNAALAGKSMLLVWYDKPFNQADTGPGAGIDFGTYRTDVVTDFSDIGWFVPADQANVALNFLTDSVDGLGNNPETDGRASQTTGGGGSNVAPVLAAIGAQATNENQALVIPLAATDADGNAIVFTAQNLPAFASLIDNGNGTGSIQVNPGFTDAGSFNITVIATDNGSPARNDSEAFTLTVNNVNRTPTLTAIANQTMDEGQILEINLSATDPDGDQISFTASSLPAFALLINNGDGTGKVRFAPGLTDAGTFNGITITASDNSSPVLSDSKSFDLTVNDKALTATIDRTQLSFVEGNPGEDRKLSFVLNLSASIAEQVTVHVTTTAGTATAGVDFSGIDTDVIFAPNQTSVTVQVPIIEDLIDEPDETIFLSLVGISGNVQASDQVTATISDDEAQAMVLSAQQITVPEGGSASPIVALLFESSFEVTVALAKEPGGDDDLTAQPAQFVFAAGSATIPQNIQLSAAEDADSVSNSATFTFTATGLTTKQLVASEADNDAQVSLTVTDADASETNTGQAANNGTIRISRAGGNANSLTVNFTLAGGAGNGVDYTQLALNAIIPAGLDFVDVVIAPVNDAVSELTETVVLTISPSINYSIVGTDNGTVTIADNDPVLVAITALDAALTEGTPATDTGQVRLSRTGSVAAALNVNITRGGAATFGTVASNTGDYNLAGPINAAGTVVTIPAGAAFVDVDVIPRDDTTPEATEALTLTLAAGTGYTLPAAPQRTVTLNIADNEPEIRLEVLDGAADESNPGGAGTATFRFHRTGPTAAPVTVNFTVAATPNPGATRGTDYVLQKAGVTVTGSSVQIDAGQAFVDLIVVPTNDAIVEPTENLTVTLTAGTTYTLDPDAADRTGVATIADNEPTINIAAIDAAAAESGTPATDTATFRISRVGNTDGPLTVNFTVGTTPTPTATRGSDYVLQKNGVTFTTNSVVIDAGQAFVDVVVVPTDDTTAEPTENVRLDLAASTAYRLDPDAADRTATVTVVDNEPKVSITLQDAEAAESGTPATDTATFRISRLTATGNLVVLFARSGNATFSAAATGGDYTLSGAALNAAATSVTIPDGQLFVDVTLAPREDTTPELTETATLTLLPLATYTIDNANKTATANLLDNEVRTISINDITFAETNGGTLNAIFNVTLSSPSSQVVTVNAATADGTASAGSDYQSAAATITFNPGQTTKMFSFVMNGDTIDEENETVLVNLTSAVNAQVAAGNAGIGVATITDNDAAPTIRINDVVVTETDAGSANATFTVSLSSQSQKPITFKAATGNATGTANTLAAAGVDFTALTLTTFNIAAGQTSATVTVPVLPDDAREFVERFAVNLSMATNATIVDAQGIATIIDDDGPTIAIADAQLTEPAAGVANMGFTVTLSEAVDVPLTVRFTTTNGTALSPADFIGAGNQLITFSPGETNKTVNVSIKSDLLDEADETFTATLSDQNLGLIGDTVATGTIIDSDPLPTITVNDVTMVEGDAGTKNFLFTVKLSAASGRDVTVGIATADSTATAGVDYTALGPTTLTFTPGQTSRTVSIPVAADTIAENTESFFVNLSNPVNATLADAQGVGTITSDEFAPAAIAGLTMNGQITGGNSGGIGNTFQMTFNIDGTFTVTDQAGSSNGTFIYTRTAKNTGRINLTSEGGPSVINLTFISISLANYVLTQGTQTEIGTLTVV